MPIIVKNLLEVRDRAAFRAWLTRFAATEPECWAVVKRGRPDGRGVFWYLDAVEEALCFGWIDSTTKKLPDGRTAQRFTPRRAGSQWSELNKARVRRLESLGLMTEQGRSVLPEMDVGAFEADPEVLQALKRDPEVWRKFQSFPPLYQRVRIDTVQIKKKDPALFASRLAKLVEATREGRMVGLWDDWGRLSDLP